MVIPCQRWRAHPHNRRGLGGAQVLGYKGVRVRVRVRVKLTIRVRVRVRGSWGYPCYTGHYKLRPDVRGCSKLSTLTEFVGPAGDNVDLYALFNPRSSADTEPCCIKCVLRELEKRGMLTPGMRVASITDHHAVPSAQTKRHGFGGVGHGRFLNDLFKVHGGTLLCPDDPSGSFLRRRRSERGRLSLEDLQR